MSTTHHSTVALTNMMLSGRSPAHEYALCSPNVKFKNRHGNRWGWESESGQLGEGVMPGKRLTEPHGVGGCSVDGHGWWLHRCKNMYKWMELSA